MIKTKTVTQNLATHCPDCGRLLTNPGYNKQHVTCCGKLHRWYKSTDVITTYDDGRDERGRFNHPTKRISVKFE